jgi:hypothetical protein
LRREDLIMCRGHGISIKWDATRSGTTRNSFPSPTRDTGVAGFAITWSSEWSLPHRTSTLLLLLSLWRLVLSIRSVSVTWLLLTDHQDRPFLAHMWLEHQQRNKSKQ